MRKGVLGMAHAKTRAVMLALVLATPCLADESSEAPAISVHRDGGAAYVTGGIGSDERDALLAAGQSYALKLTFAGGGDGAYVAEVDVKILDGKGQPVLAASDTGPYLFVDLPPGTYRVTATLHGRALEKTVAVTAGRQASAGFYW
jgi:hypothetical protein